MIGVDEKYTTTPEVFDLRMTRVCHGSRRAYLNVFSLTLPLWQEFRGLHRRSSLRFDNETIIYIENYSEAVFDFSSRWSFVPPTSTLYQPMPGWTKSIKHLAVNTCFPSSIVFMPFNRSRKDIEFSEFLIRYFNNLRVVTIIGSKLERVDRLNPLVLTHRRRISFQYMQSLLSQLSKAMDKLGADGRVEPKLRWIAYGEALDLEP